MDTCSDIALAQAAGPMKDLLDKLSGENGASWLEAFKLVLRTQPHLLIARVKELALKLWKKHPVGGNTWSELRRRLKSAAYKVSNVEKIGIQQTKRAQSISSRLETTRELHMDEVVDFVMGSLSGLFGFEEETVTGAVVNEAFLAKHGLERCRPSDSFYLRLSYTDQPPGELVRVGMRPIAGFEVETSVFVLAHRSDGLCIDALSECDREGWKPRSLWVFRRKAANP